MKHKAKILLASTVIVSGLLVAGGVSYARHICHDRGGRGEHAQGHYEGRHGHAMGMMLGQRDRDLTEAEVRKVAEAFLLMHGNDRLKVGAITEGPNKGYLLQLLTQDDSPALEVELDRRTGRPLHGAGRGMDQTRG